MPKLDPVPVGRQYNLVHQQTILYQVQTNTVKKAREREIKNRKEEKSEKERGKGREREGKQDGDFASSGIQRATKAPRGAENFESREKIGGGERDRGGKGEGGKEKERVARLVVAAGGLQRPNSSFMPSIDYDFNFVINS